MSATLTRVISAARRDTSGQPSGRATARWGLLAVALLLALLAGVAIGHATRAQHEVLVKAPPATSVPGPGPQRLVDGVASGFAHTPAGAEAAAASVGLEIQRAIDAGNPRREAMLLSQRALPGEARALEARADKGISEEWVEDEAPEIRRLVISSQIRAYSPQRASVRYWEELIGRLGHRELPRAAFRMAHATVVWRAGDWRLAQIAEAVGPAPGWRSSQEAVLRAMHFPGEGEL